MYFYVTVNRIRSLRTNVAIEESFSIIILRSLRICLALRTQVRDTCSYRTTIAASLFPISRLEPVRRGGRHVQPLIKSFRAYLVLVCTNSNLFPTIMNSNSWEYSHPNGSANQDKKKGFMKRQLGRLPSFKLNKRAENLLVRAVCLAGELGLPDEISGTVSGSHALRCAGRKEAAMLDCECLC